MKKSTKPSAKSCKVGKPPIREEYAACRKEVRRWRRTAALRPISDAVDAAWSSWMSSSLFYQPPHTLPPYGGRCYIQVYQENMLWLQLCYIMQAYISAWGVSDDCLNPIAAR